MQRPRFHLKQSPYTHQDGGKIDPTRSKNSGRHGIHRPLLFMTAVVALFVIVDFPAILERPTRPFRPSLRISDDNAPDVIPTTLILMIETRDPPLPKTVCINRDYARRHGYHFRLVEDHDCFREYGNRFHVRSHLWCRPLIFLDALRSYDSVLYVDSDAYFTNPDVSIEDFFDRVRRNRYFSFNDDLNATFVGAEDCGRFLANGGIQFWRRTSHAEFMLRSWFLLYRHQFVLYWLRLSWLPSYEIHYFSNREQGSLKVAIEEDPNLGAETTLVRYGPETWNLPYSSRECIEDPHMGNGTYYLNHITSTFGHGTRNRWLDRHAQSLHLDC